MTDRSGDSGREKTVKKNKQKWTFFSTALVPDTVSTDPDWICRSKEVYDKNGQNVAKKYRNIAFNEMRILQCEATSEHTQLEITQIES